MKAGALIFSSMWCHSPCTVRWNGFLRLGPKWSVIQAENASLPAKGKGRLYYLCIKELYQSQAEAKTAHKTFCKDLKVSYLSFAINQRFTIKAFSLPCCLCRTSAVPGQSGPTACRVLKKYSLREMLTSPSQVSILWS